MEKQYTFAEKEVIRERKVNLMILEEGEKNTTLQ